MPQNADPLASTRRGFLATTGGVLAGAVAGPRAFADAAQANEGSETSAPKPRRRIPIGVFDPAFPDLTLDQLLEMPRCGRIAQSQEI